jgi:hypothetical protein
MELWHMYHPRVKSWNTTLDGQVEAVVQNGSASDSRAVSFVQDMSWILPMAEGGPAFLLMNRSMDRYKNDPVYLWILLRLNPLDLLVLRIYSSRLCACPLFCCLHDCVSRPGLIAPQKDGRNCGTLFPSTLSR